VPTILFVYCIIMHVSIYKYDFNLYVLHVLSIKRILLARIKGPRVRRRYIIQTNSSHSFQPRRLVAGVAIFISARPRRNLRGHQS